MTKAPLTFYKMHGCGNDFILVDNRPLKFTPNQMEQLAKTLCPRALSVGADGLILLDDPIDPANAYRFHYYNADGSRAAMCGNGGRCAAWLAIELFLAPLEHAFETDAGIMKAAVDQTQHRVKLTLPPPKNLLTNRGSHRHWTLHFVETGVPHTVVLVDDLASIDVHTLGREIRNLPLFAPRGTNVNFIEVIDSTHLRIRTYERGIEDETLACATGSTASAVITNHLGITGTCVDILTRSGDTLTITIGRELWLEGPVVSVFRGTIQHPDILNIFSHRSPTEAR